MSTNAFLPEGYQAPKSGGYAKLEAGDNKYRILSNPLPLWLIWADGKPSRLPYVLNGAVTAKPAKPTGENASVKEAWAMVVWSYKDEEIQVMEIAYASIKNALQAHANAPAWGHPKGYDIYITKSGSGRDTKYSFRADPPTPISTEIAAAQVEKPVDLNQLLIEGGDPFVNSAAPAASLQPATPAPAAQAQPATPAGEDPPF